MAQAQVEVKGYREQLEQQKDYEKIKQERDQLKTELSQKEVEYNNSLQQKENQIITKIISELKLEQCETNLEQVLVKIKELIINKTPNDSQETNLRQQITEKNKEIKRLREQNKENYSPISKEQVEKKLKTLGIENLIYQKELAQIASPRELENFYQQVIKKEIDKKSREKNKIEGLNAILWVLFTISLLSIIVLVIKMKRNKLPAQNKRLER